MSFQPLQEEEEEQLDSKNGEGGESSDVAVSPTALEGAERGERPAAGSLRGREGAAKQACKVTCCLCQFQSRRSPGWR